MLGLLLHNLNLSVALGLDFIELVHERIDVFEFTVNGSKANIGDFVDLLELIHGISADECGRHFAVERVLQERFNLVYDALQCFQAVRGVFRRRAEGRSTACCGQKASRDLSFYNDHRHSLNDFIGRKAFCAV